MQMTAMMGNILFPRLPDPSEGQEPRKVLSRVRGSIVDQSMVAFLVFAVPTGAAHLFAGGCAGRAWEWTILTAGALLLAAVLAMRRKASAPVRAVVTIGLWLAIGAAGLLSWGLAGCKLLLLISAGGLTALIFGPWAGSLAILGSRSRELERHNVCLEAEFEDRRRAEAALRAGEERLSRLVECIRESIFVVAADGRFLDVNAYACQATGYRREELLAMSVPDLDIDFDREAVESIFRNLETGASTTVEGTHRRKDGSTYPVEISISRMGTGEDACAVALARDISERKLAEAAAARRYRSEKLITEISSRFIHLPSPAVDRNIESALEQVCRFAELDAAYLLRVADQTGQLAAGHFWQKEKHQLTPDALDALLRRSMDWQRGRFKRNEATAAASMADVPLESGIDTAVLERSRIGALLEVPMIYSGRGVGVVGLICRRQPRPWSEMEVTLLKMIGQVFTQALERKRSETALRNSEATLRSILRTVPVGIGTAENRRIRGGNRRLFDMLGYTEEELVGENFRILYPDPEEYDRVGEKLHKRLGSEGKAEIETRWRCKDGRILDILLSASVVESAGPAGGITLAAMDITERKGAEKALRESERNYREIFNAAQEAIFIHDAETGRILAVNRAMGEMFGYTEQEARRLPLERISARQGAEGDRDMLRRIRRAVEKGPQVFEHRSKKNSGEAFWTEVTLKSTEIGGQGRVLAVVRNIDHRKRAEKALRESEERFRNLVENAPAGICIVRNDRIIYLNPEQEKIVGPLSGVRDIYQLQLHPDDTAKFIQHYRPVRDGMQRRSNLEIRFFSTTPPQQDEAPRWVHCDISVIPYEGKPAILITMVDMTRTKELEKLVHFREKMVSLGHVAAGIAHEIRNPLSGINVLIDGIRENFQDPDSVDDIFRLLNETQKASDKIAAVIKRVLDFSRPSQPHLSLTDINLPVREALELSKTTLRKAGIILETDLNDSLPPLYIDQQMIEQVIMNLLSNAIEALKADCPEKRLRVRSRQSNGYVIVDIADSGPGVPDAFWDKIFDPFYTTRSDGSGIGLSLCQRLVADHGGNISISKSDWGGAEFSIRIPTEKRMAIR
jgi:PAS domain S-box-containing protein